MGLEDLDDATLEELIRSRFVTGMASGGAGDVAKGVQGIVLMAGIELMRRTTHRQGEQMIELSRQMVENSTALRDVTHLVAARNAEVAKSTGQLVAVTQGMDAVYIQTTKQNDIQNHFVNRMTFVNIAIAAIAGLAAVVSVIASLLR